MRVLLVSEGKHEQEGALEQLVSRLLARAVEVEHDRIANPRIHAHHGRGQGFFKRAVRWMGEAQKRGFDVLVLVTDEDGYAERRAELDSAQDNTLFMIRRALGLAIRTFDAWMLADEQALTMALHQTIQRQEDPEMIKDPKGRCREFLDACGNPLAQSEMYARVAENANLETIEVRCPRGFAPFAKRIRALL